MMRIPVRNMANGCLSAVSYLLTAALEVMLFGVFMSHLRRAFAVEKYRPVYLRSGRRNRVRC
jgi:hypothetical protein